MPRAFCPECGSEVPVDDDGVCHVGHRVDVGATSGHDATASGADDPTAPDLGDADEPQPWVASVDSTTLGGFTPPPGDAPVAEPEGEPWTPASDPSPADAGSGGDDLAAAAAAAVESIGASPADDEPRPGPDPVEGQGDQVEAGWPQTLPSEGEVPGWTPPTNDPAAPPPVPPPAPVDPPAAGDESDDFDLDDLAAAVSELGMDDAAPAPSSPAPAAPTEPVAPVDGAAPSDDHAAWEDDLGEPDVDAGTGEAVDDTTQEGPSSSAPPSDAASDADPVDLSNFTAKGGKAPTDAEKGRRFRRR